MKNALRALLKVALQDIVIMVGFVLLAPIAVLAAGSLPGWLHSLVMLALLVVYFFLLFYSNAELFKWTTNDYLWSLGAGLLTLFGLVIPSVMWVSHHNIYGVIKHALT